MAMEMRCATLSLIDELSRQRATALSLSALFRGAQRAATSSHERVGAARFLHRELPIRMAQRIAELQQLPANLSEEPHIQWVVDTYSAHVQSLVDAREPETALDEEQFSTLIATLLADRTSVPSRLALAAHAHRARATEANDDRAVDDAMEPFFTSRVGLRFLVEHYLAR